MGKKVAFATTNWVNRPSKPATSITQGEWDSEASSTFSGFPFPIYFGKKWAGESALMSSKFDFRKVVPGWYEFNTSNGTETFPAVSPPQSTTSPARVGKFCRPIINPEFDHIGPFTLEEVTRLWWTAKCITINNLTELSANVSINDDFGTVASQATCADTCDITPPDPDTGLGGSKYCSNIELITSNTTVTLNVSKTLTIPGITPGSSLPKSTNFNNLNEDTKVTAGGLQYVGPTNYEDTLPDTWNQEYATTIGCFEGESNPGSGAILALFTGDQTYLTVGHYLIFAGYTPLNYQVISGVGFYVSDSPIVCDIDSPNDYYIKIYQNRYQGYAVSYGGLEPVMGASETGSTTGANVEPYLFSSSRSYNITHFHYALPNFPLSVYIEGQTNPVIAKNIGELNQEIARINGLSNPPDLIILVPTQNSMWRSQAQYSVTLYRKYTPIPYPLSFSETTSTFSYFEGKTKTVKSFLYSFSDEEDGGLEPPTAPRSMAYSNPDFAVSEYWEYDDGNGNPIYDKDTGAMLRDPVTGTPV